MKKDRHYLRVLTLILGLILVLYWAMPSRTAGTLDRIRERGFLLWGSDSEGGGGGGAPPLSTLK